MHNIDAERVEDRMRASISLCWSIFSQKVGSKLLRINKEASMQLQYAYLLRQMVPLITHTPDEQFEVELETGIQINGRNREVDLLFSYHSEYESPYVIAIEMKCYRDITSSGGKRGATDIFMKDVYEDLHLLECYEKAGHADAGVGLVMNDLQRLVSPKNKDAKCWDYDISDGAAFGPCRITTPIGGKAIDITLNKSYRLDWRQTGEFWFLEAQGTQCDS